jgi:hypothetical protein
MILTAAADFAKSQEGKSGFVPAGGWPLGAGAIMRHFEPLDPGMEYIGMGKFVERGIFV